MRPLSRLQSTFAFFLATLFVAGCGGSSSGSGGGGTGPTADFAVAVNPTTLSLTAGAAGGSVTIAVTGLNGFSGQVAIATSGAPANVTLSPASFIVTAGASQQMTIIAASAAVVGNATITIQASSGSLSHTISIPLAIASSPPAGDFTVTLAPNSSSLTAGSSQSVLVNVTALNGFTGAVQLNVSGLPSGVSGSASAISVTSGSGSGSLELVASPLAATASSSATVTARSAGLTHTAPLAVSVGPYAPPSGDPFSTVGGSVLHGFYDTQRDLLYTTNPVLNEVEVVSPSTLSVLHRISIPQPMGIDQMPDGKTLVIGTMTQGVYFVDEDTLISTALFVPQTNAPSPILAPAFPVALSNGKILFIAISVQGHIPQGYVYGGELYVFDPSALTYQPAQLPPAPGYLTPETEHLARSGDHKYAIFDQYQGTVGLYSATTGTITTTSNGFYAADVAGNADGSLFAESINGSIDFYDRNLNLLASTALPPAPPSQVGPGATAEWYGMQFSEDGTALFVQSTGAASIPQLLIFNATSFKQTGEFSAGFGPSNAPAYLLAVRDPSHLLVSADGGIGVIDASNAKASQAGLPLAGDPRLVPDSAALGSGATASYNLSWNGTFTATVGGKSAIVSNSLGGVSLEVPPSNVLGPVDVVFTAADGSSLVLPQAFTYGVLPVSLDTTLVPQGVPSPVMLYGFGLAPGNVAPGVDLGPVAATVDTTSGFTVGPSALEAIELTTPALTTSAGTTVTNANGSGTLANSVGTLKTTIVPSTLKLSMLTYDAHRSLIYAGAAGSAQIAVLSPTTLTWQASLQPPGAKSNASYQYVALTADDSKLVALDIANGTLSVFDPDQPATGESISLFNSSLPGAPPSGSSAVSLGLTSSGKAWIALAGAYPAEVNLATMSLSYRTDNFALKGCFPFRNSSDGTQIVAGCAGNSGGNVSLYNAATDTFSQQQYGSYLGDFTISNDGQGIAAIYIDQLAPDDVTYFIDGQGHLVNYVAYPDLALPTSRAVPGILLSPKGSVFVLPRQNSIDLIDYQTGTLSARIATPEATVNSANVAALHDDLTMDPTGRTLYAISASGVTVFNLPLPLDGTVASTWPYLRLRGGGISVR